MIIEGFDGHVPKGNIYFAMAFSVMAEMVNLRMRMAEPVKLHKKLRDWARQGTAMPGMAVLAGIAVRQRLGLMWMRFSP